MSIKRINFRRPHQRVVALAGLAFWLAPPTWSVAGEPAARLLGPQAAIETHAIVPRASGDDPFPSEPAPPVVKTRERAPDFEFPPPYSQSSSLLNFSWLWDRKTRTHADAREQPRVGAAAQVEGPQQAIAQVHHRSASGAIMVSPTVGEAPQIPQPEAPAWRWYGYGAPVPGHNPYAPDGVYAPVHPNYFHQTGATPGAIPRPLLPMMPTAPANPAPPILPAPSKVEPPRIMSQPVEAPPATTESAPDFNVRPATLDIPVPVTEPAIHQTWKPLPSQSPSPTVRAQSPEPDSLVAIRDALRGVSSSSASQIDWRQSGATGLRLTVKLPAGVLADQLADRISRLPALSGYDIEMEFNR